MPEDRFLTIQNLESLPPPKWLIEGVIEQNAIGMVVGPPGAFKSFLAIDWALCLSLGRPWNGRLCEASKCLYGLGEGKANLLKRIQAWECHHDLNVAQKAKLNSNFRVTFDVPQLAQPRDFIEFLNDLDMDGFEPSVFIIDTLARSFVGKNENDQLDSGIWIEHADMLRQRNMTIIILHHTKKNTEMGLQYRGSTVWEGAMDTVFILQKNPDGMKGFAKLSCTKQKDHEELPDIWMQRQAIVPPNESEGSIVLVETERPGIDDDNMKTNDREQMDIAINALLEDAEFGSDRARARILAETMGISEATAQSRIHRARRKVN